MIVARIAAVVIGVVLVAWVLDAAIRTFMLPRASRVRLTRWIGRAIGRVLNLLAPPSRSYEWRDKVHSLRPPLTLLSFQASWLFIVFVGFSIVFWGMGESFLAATHYSGSALFTLGFASPAGSGLLFVVCAEAAIGLTLLALLISYLPTIYAAFQKREFMVAKLAIRAGFPASPWHALAIAHQTDSIGSMDGAMWGEWEDWFIAIAESHASLVILSFYRSPDPDNHWISAARTVLDLAALRIAVVDIPDTVAPRITIRSGSIALRTVAEYFRLPHASNPQARDPISITRAQFDAACDYLVANDVPVKPDREQAWIAFAGWRVNYDTTISATSKAFIAPPDPWDTIHEGVSSFAG